MRAAVTLAVLLAASSPPALAACNKTITVAETQQMDYGTIAVTSGGGTVTMVTTNAGANPTLNPAGGVLDFNVGADLVVNAGQAAGSYSGAYTVTVIY